MSDRLREAAELVARHCTDIVRLPNAEHVADAHNAALSELRAALAEKPVPEWLSKDDAETQLSLALKDAKKQGPLQDDKVLLAALNRRGIWLAWIGETP